MEHCLKANLKKRNNMEKKIRLSKVYYLTNSIGSCMADQSAVLILLLTEIKRLTHGTQINELYWDLNETKNTDLHRKITTEINQFTMELFRANKGFDASIISRNDFVIPLDFVSVIINHCDLRKSITCKFYFKTKEMYLIESFGKLILLKEKINDLNTFIIDLGDSDISIIDYIKKD